ncbi:unnamed protein product, partial [Ectocarpus sp. 12 AP-2014]
DERVPRRPARDQRGGLTPGPSSRGTYAAGCLTVPRPDCGMRHRRR